MKQYLYFDERDKIHRIFPTDKGPLMELPNGKLRYTLIGEISEIVHIYDDNKVYKSPYNNSVTSHCKCGLVKNGIQMCVRTDCDNPNHIRSITKI